MSLSQATMVSSAVLPEICVSPGVLSFGTVMWRSSAAFSPTRDTFYAVLHKIWHETLFFSFLPQFCMKTVYMKHFCQFYRSTALQFAPKCFFRHLCRSTVWQSLFLNGFVCSNAVLNYVWHYSFLLLFLLRTNARMSHFKLIFQFFYGSARQSYSQTISETSFFHFWRSTAWKSYIWSIFGSFIALHFAQKCFFFALVSQ